jgi:signal transduction histidine kinase
MKDMEPVLSYTQLHQLTGDGLDHSGEFRILVVDDSEFDSELVLRELHHQSQIKFTSKVATNKSSYMQALTDFLPDVVYCDLHITPDFNGVDAVRILKNEYPEVPFVLVTGSISEEVVSLCMSEGIDDYVLKTNMARLPLSLMNAIKIRKIELQKKEAYEKLVKSEKQIRNFAKHLNHVLEEERSSIAREIHDELGQQLAGIKIGISTFKRPDGTDPKIEEKVNEMMKDMDLTIQSLRKIATALRPGILDTLGLIPSIVWLGSEFEKKTKVQCTHALHVKEQKFEKDISTCFFRICQEALTNISKHAQASEVTIQVNEKDHELTMKISDNGKGIASEKLENPFSMGLLGMRERAGIIGAQLLIISHKNEGTTIQLKVKLPQSEVN